MIAAALGSQGQPEGGRGGAGKGKGKAQRLVSSLAFVTIISCVSHAAVARPCKHQRCQICNHSSIAGNPCFPIPLEALACRRDARSVPRAGWEKRSSATPISRASPGRCPSSGNAVPEASPVGRIPLAGISNDPHLPGLADTISAHAGVADL